MSGQLEIGPIVITAGKENDYSINGFGGGYGPPPIPGWLIGIYADLVASADEMVHEEYRKSPREYEAAITALPKKAEAEFSDIEAQANAVGKSLTEKLGFQVKQIEAKIAERSAAYRIQFDIAKSYDGADPTTGFRIPNGSFPGDFYYHFAQDWIKSHKAAYEAKLLNAEAKILNDHLTLINDALSTAIAEEQARLTREAEAQRLAAEAAQTVRAANTFRSSGSAAATGPLVITAAGTISTLETAAATLQAAIRSAISALSSLLAGTASGLLVGVSALIYSPKLANGELPERYVLSTPLSDLVPSHTHDLNALASTGGTIDLPVRISSKTAADGRSEVFIVKTDGTAVPSKVNIVAASYDVEQRVYTVTTNDAPPRTLIWTPITAPGNSSTSLPTDQPEPPVYVGATVTPVEGRVDYFPGISEASFDDFITVFPIDSGLAPLYIMFRDRREDPGIVTGDGQAMTGPWLGAASQGEGAPIPSQIADKLRGQEFKNFRAFREAFWKAVANDSELNSQFNRQNLSIMLDGKAPFSSKSEWVGKSVKFEIHHKNLVSQGGAIFDIDNIYVVTPKRHKVIHGKGN